MASNYKVSTDIDTLLRKSTKEEVATFLGVDTNTADIATNTANIATNTADIATNTADIATNTADIATNTADIATNAGNIATNTGNIATNTADIAKIVTYPYTTDFQGGVEQTRNLTSITDLSGYNGNNSLTSIYVGTNVTSITSRAFYYCSSLTSITLPDGLTSIGFRVFSYCTSLTSITIPDSVIKIGYNAFNGCNSATSISIGSGIQTIQGGAFNNCNSVDRVDCYATTAPNLVGPNQFGVNTTEIHVPVGATGYDSTYGGLTVVYDL